MKRDFQKLSRDPFDLLVVGGGIYGAWMAYDAALRGLRVAIVERRDWAAGTSSASSKLIHGGLRYLEQARIGLVRKSLLERRRLIRQGPHRVSRLRFAVPVYEGARIGRRRLGLGLLLYDLLAGRTHGRRSFSPRRMQQNYPLLNPTGLVGGFTYWDSRTDDARLTLEIVDGAMRSGAVAVNHAAATRLLIEGTRVVGAAVEDDESGQVVDVRASATINAAGPWAEQLLPDVASPSTRLALAKGVHLVMPALPTADAFLLNSEQDGRVVFLIPWYGRTLLGTTDTLYEGDPDRPAVDPQDVAYLLDAANRFLAGMEWTARDVISSFVGLRALPRTEGVVTSVLSREWQVEKPMDGLLTCSGGKLTSARTDAARAVDRAMRMLGRQPGRTPTTDRPLPWRPDERYSRWSRDNLIRGLNLGLDEATTLCCLERYGSRVEGIFELVEELPKLAQRIIPDMPFCMAEILFAPRQEMARTLDDVMRRRIPLAILTPLPRRTLQWAASMIGSVLKWSEQRRSREVATMMRTPGVHS